MLNIEYGSYQKLYDKYGEDFIYDPDMYFNNTYDEKMDYIRYSKKNNKRYR